MAEITFVHILTSREPNWRLNSPIEQPFQTRFCWAPLMV